MVVPRRIRSAVLVASLFAVPAFAQVLAPPRPLSDAEREAVALAARYLDRGPEAFAEALAAASPLRALPAATALQEIEVRAGGRAEARWELRTTEASAGDLAVFSIEAPSGLDDTLAIRMVREGDAWRVLWLKSFHEPWITGRSLAVRAPDAGDGGLEVPFAVAIVLGGAAAFLLLLGVSYLPDRPAVAAVAGAAGAAVVALMAFLLSGRVPLPGLSRHAPALFAKMRRGSDIDRFGRLVQLRRRLEAGEPREASACLALAKQNPEPMAQLWIAERLLASGAAPEARRILASLRDADLVPWSAVLRARMAFLEKRDAAALAAYVTATRGGVAHDGILVEALEVARALGFERPDLEIELRLAALGSRSADARVALAAGLVQDEKRDRAEAALLSAWRERPLDREELLADGDVQELLHRPAVLKLLDLSAAAEKPVAAEETGRRPVPLPGSAAARVCGRRLRLVIGTSELQVPGGAELAPAGSVAEDAAAERRELVARALETVPALSADPPGAGALVQPVVRTKVMRTVSALARTRQWGAIAAVTARLAESHGQAPAELLMLRAQALRRSGDAAGALALLVDLAASPALERRDDPMAFYELGEMFVSLEDYGRGLKFLKKAAARMRPELLQERLAQVRTEQQLAARFDRHTSPHFEVRYPPERRDGFGAEAARVLEAERQRLGKWLPAREDLKTTVQVIWLSEFLRTYGAGGDVIGLWDGKIRVPLAGVGRFGPFAVSIVTHELAHALISDLTKDNAPRWFHEGLAQHVEMRRSRPNDMVQYQAQGAILALPVIEAVLERFPDPYFVEQAYQEASWAVAYIDAKWGPEGLKRLMAAYRDGLSGDAALGRALGVDTARLSGDFIAWSLRQPNVLHDEIVAYDDVPDEGFHWSKPRTGPVTVPDTLLPPPQ